MVMRRSLQMVSLEASRDVGSRPAPRPWLAAGDGYRAVEAVETVCRGQQQCRGMRTWAKAVSLLVLERDIQR